MRGRGEVGKGGAWGWRGHRSHGGGGHGRGWNVIRCGIHGCSWVLIWQSTSRCSLPHRWICTGAPRDPADPVPAAPRGRRVGAELALEPHVGVLTAALLVEGSFTKNPCTVLPLCCTHHCPTCLKTTKCPHCPEPESRPLEFHPTQADEMGRNLG